jgi:hypothetical protein
MTKTDETSTLAEVRTDDVRTDTDVTPDSDHAPHSTIVTGAHSSAALEYGDIGTKQRRAARRDVACSTFFCPIVPFRRWW